LTWEEREKDGNDLKETLDGCEKVLHDVKKKLDKHSGLDQSGHGKKGGLRDTISWGLRVSSDLYGIQIRMVFYAIALMSLNNDLGLVGNLYSFFKLKFAKVGALKPCKLQIPGKTERSP